MSKIEKKFKTKPWYDRTYAHPKLVPKLMHIHMLLNDNDQKTPPRDSYMKKISKEREGRKGGRPT